MSEGVGLVSLLWIDQDTEVVDLLRATEEKLLAAMCAHGPLHFVVVWALKGGVLELWGRRGWLEQMAMGGEMEDRTLVGYQSSGREAGWILLDLEWSDGRKLGMTVSTFGWKYRIPPHHVEVR